VFQNFGGEAHARAAITVYANAWTRTSTKQSVIEFSLMLIHNTQRMDKSLLDLFLCL